MRVLHIAETIKGGIATYLRNVLPLQAERYGRENVLALMPGDQLDELEGVGVHVEPLARRGNRLFTALGAARLLRSHVRTFRPTVVHVHSSFAGLTCRPVLRLMPNRPRVVYCPHGWAFVRVGSHVQVAAWVERRLARWCDAIVCVSEAERSSALRAGLPAGKLRVIVSGLPVRGVSVAPAQHDADAPLRLLFVGRFDRAKGFDVLLAALSNVRRSVTVDVFGEAVLGDGSSRDLPSCVHLHGWRPFAAIEPFLQCCDALVMPSRWEGLPLSAIEAMRAGKAVIASRVGGLPELVEDGVTGHLVGPDDAGALARTLDAADAKRLAEMGAAGRKRFLEKFRVEDCEASLAKLYEEVLRV